MLWDTDDIEEPSGLDLLPWCDWLAEHVAMLATESPEGRSERVDARAVRLTPASGSRHNETTPSRSVCG
jgi:hypothetical protein